MLLRTALVVVDHQQGSVRFPGWLRSTRDLTSSVLGHGRITEKRDPLPGRDMHLDLCADQSGNPTHDCQTESEPLTAVT